MNYQERTHSLLAHRTAALIWPSKPKHTWPVDPETLPEVGHWRSVQSAARHQGPCSPPCMATAVDTEHAVPDSHPHW
jgi:hypothetical protein